MDRFEQLKTKYAPVLTTIKNRGVNLKNLHVEQDKLVIRGAAPNDAIKNEVWNAIKQVDPAYGDLSADLTIDSSLPVPEQASAAETYTVQAGDTLSKISKHFYGDAKKYAKIFDANRDQLADPDKIRPGQVLRIPAA